MVDLLTLNSRTTVTWDEDLILVRIPQGYAETKGSHITHQTAVKNTDNFLDISWGFSYEQGMHQPATWNTFAEESKAAQQPLRSTIVFRRGGAQE